MSKTDRKKCSKCQKERNSSRDFYMSNSDSHADGRISVCKQCIIEDLEVDNTDEYMSEDFIDKVKDILLDMNRPYIHDVWISSVEEAIRRDRRIFGVLMKNINLNHRNKNWRDSEFPSDKELKEAPNEVNSPEKEEKDAKKRESSRRNDELNDKNEKDVLRLLGYDPFEHESDDDKPQLYNKLIDYLSEDVLEDGFRLSSVISIVRTFHQIDRVDAAMATSSASELGTLITAKEKMLRVALNIAKENGISVGANAKSSAGSGTLTGIMKQLADYDFNEATVNLFEIETAKGIKQVADLSNESIIKQLQFDENDMSEMIRDQRELIENFEERAKRYEEDNRLLRVELDKRNKQEEKLREQIRDLERRIG